MAAAEGHRDGPESFQHLFPPLAVTKTPEVETPPQIQRNTDATNSSGNGDLEHVDYVIVFKFPTPSQQREEEQKKVTDELKKLTSRLQRVGLRFQVKPGRTKDMLLILVSCPEETLYEEFKRERVRDFLLGIRIHGMGNEEDSDDFADEEYQHLTEAERLRTVHEILTGPENEGGASISPNVDPYVESIMPLHNKEFDEAWIKAWSKKWLISRKDLMSIRNHFGEKIAFYFAFVQNYLLWLSGPAVLGLLITVTGARSLSIWYSLAMLIWSVLFIEVWKRQEKELAIVWNVRNCSKHEKRRLEFKGDKTVPDPVTGEEMPYAPIWKIFLRRAISLPGVAVGAIALAVIVASVIAIQLFLHEYYTGPFHQILHYTPTILYVLFIPSMSNIYSNWVRLLNDWEMHKTESSWEYHYTQKIFIANFLVSYLSLFFIGWIYIPFSEHVLPYLVQLNISHEHKKVDFQRLRGQLIYFIVTGQIIGFCTEMLLPYAMKLITPKIKKFTKKDNDQNQEAATASPSESRLIEKIYKQVDRPEYNIYTDYVEMIIQFGYVSMFSTVWPLTALCCMINNWIELRGDAVKLCKYTRRPAPLRAEGVGPWIGNMETLTWLSSITMASFAYMFHPSTDLHSPYTPIFALLAVLLSEHLYVVVQFVVRSALDAIPSVSDILVRKQEFKMKKVWLNRLLVRETRDGKGRAEADTASGGVNTAAELEAKEQEEEAIRLIQNAFKTE